MADARRSRALARAPRRNGRRRRRTSDVELAETSQEHLEAVARGARIRALRGLARICEMCKASGGSQCARVEKAAFALLRALLCASNKFDESRAADHDAAHRFHVAFEQWCATLGPRVQAATDLVSMAAKASPLHRYVRAVAIRKNLIEAAREMEALLADYTQEFLPCLEVAEQQRVKQVLDCVRAHYATYEVERDMRVRDMQEEKLAEAIRAKLEELHRVVLRHGEELCRQHEADKARCGKITQRMDRLGIDLAARPTNVRLEPLPHSPRLLAGNTAEIDPQTHVEMGRLRSVPDDPRLRFYHVNTHRYVKNERPDNRPDELAGILMAPEAEHELPRRKALDDFRKTTDWALADDHRLVLEALAATCLCNTSEIISDLQALNPGELGFRTRHLSRIALHVRPSKSVIFAYLHLEGSPAKYSVSLTHQREDRDGDSDDETRDRAAILDPWETANDLDEIRKAEAAEAELGRMRRVVRHTLHIEHYSRLLNESNGNKVIRRLEDVRPGDTIAVDAAADSLRKALRVCLAQANAQETTDLLARHLDRPALVTIACEALTELLASDDYAGSADPVRSAFLREGGVNMLLSIVDIFRAGTSDVDRDAAGAALETLHAIAIWRKDALRRELLMHKAVLRCANALYDFNAHPKALQHACGVICVLTETENGRDAISRLPQGAAYICSAMLTCPIKRAFATAQKTACECVANAVLQHPENAATLAHAPDDAGVRFLSEVMTRAPGNIPVYRSVCAALDRLARYEGRALLRCHAAALETVIHAMGRFESDEHVQAHGLMTLAYAAQHARRQRQFIFCESSGFRRISAALSQAALAETHWRAAYVLCELVRGRGPGRRCSRLVLETMLHERIIEKLVEVAFDAKSGAADPRLALWTFRFLRYLVRGCSRARLARPTVDGTEPLDSSGSEAGGDEEDDDASDDEDPAQRDVSSQEPPKPPPEPEVCKRAKGESLAAFLKRQAVADAEAQELRDAYLKALEEAKLPPAELRKAWQSVLAMLAPDREGTFGRAVDALGLVAGDPRAAREGAHLVYVWLQAEESVLAASAPAVSRALAIHLCSAVYACRHDIVAIEMLVQAWHVLLDLVATALGDRLRQQREHKLLLARLAREREKQESEAFSVFADVFRTLEGRANLALDAPPPELPPPPAWVAACLDGLAEGRAEDRLEMARVRFAGASPPLAASLACLQSTLDRFRQSIAAAD